MSTTQHNVFADELHLPFWVQRRLGAQRQRIADLESDMVQTCPHVRTSADGTSYCTLAEAGARRGDQG